MPIDHLGHQYDALLRRHVRQAEQSSVWDVMHKNQLPKIGINCNQYPFFRVCEFQ